MASPRQPRPQAWVAAGRFLRPSASAKARGVRRGCEAGEGGSDAALGSQNLIRPRSVTQTREVSRPLCPFTSLD